MNNINPKRDENVKLNIPEGVRMQNKRGEWIPVIPEPYYLSTIGDSIRGFPDQMQCDCGKKFWRRESYDGHYALKHILAV